MIISNPQGLSRISLYLFFLLLVVVTSLPAGAEEPSAEGKVLTMTGLKRDTMKSTTESMKFTGLRRQSVVTTPAEPEKTNKQ